VTNAVMQCNLIGLLISHPLKV